MIVNIILSLANVYTLLIFIYVMMSWIPIQGGVLADINRILGTICDPYLNLFRRIIPPIGGVLDLSPILALLVLQFGVRLLVRIF